MKKIVSLILLVIIAIAIPAGAKKKKADIKLAETSYNFGTIPEHGGKVSHTFEFTNVGDANLVIIDATADCGCTVPEFPTRPIAPGKKGHIKVTFDPLYRQGAFNKTVTIRTNATQKKVRIKISGTINNNK